MKKTIKIEIETSTDLQVFPEEGTSEEDYSMGELIEFRRNYARELSDKMVEMIEHFVKEQLPENFMGEAEELYVEGLDEFKDYKIHIIVKDNKDD